MAATLTSLTKGSLHFPLRQVKFIQYLFVLLELKPRVFASAGQVHHGQSICPTHQALTSVRRAKCLALSFGQVSILREIVIIADAKGRTKGSQIMIV